MSIPIPPAWAGTLLLMLATSICTAGAATLKLQPDGGTSPFKSAARAIAIDRMTLDTLAVGGERSIELPGGPATIVFDRIDRHGAGIQSSVGYLKDLGKEYRVILTTGPGGTFGSIRTPRTVYRVVPRDGRDWIVDSLAEREFEGPTDLRDDILPHAEPTALAIPAAGFTNKAAPAGQATIDVMVAYTEGFARRLGAGTLTRIHNLIAAANTAYIDSEISVTVRLVNATMINYPDTSTDQVAINDFLPVNGGGNGVLPILEQVRIQSGADLVAVLRNGPDFKATGLAWLSSTTLEPQKLYSVSTGCVVGCDWVFIHELGHNMGVTHDRATKYFSAGGHIPTGGAYPYSFGHFYCVNGLTCDPYRTPANGGCAVQPACNSATVNDFGTIMSYFDPKVLKFSNPDINCLAVGGTVPHPCGISEITDPANAANSAKSINNLRFALQDVKAAIVGAPPGALQFAATEYFRADNSGTVTLAVKRLGGAAGAVSVDYTTADGSARAGYDYTAASGTLVWADGDTADKLIVVDLFNDGVSEGSESFRVVLGNVAGPAGVFIGYPAAANVVLNEAWPPNGAAPAGFAGSWTVANDEAYEGTFSLRSPAVLGPNPNNMVYGNADIDTTANFAAGQVSFAYRISTAGTTWGQLEFFIDGISQFASAGGDPGWQTISIPITAGMHTLRWRMKNRASVPCNGALTVPPPPANCRDRAWIDAVTLPLALPASTTTLASSANPGTAGSTINLTASLAGAAGTPAGVVTFRDGGQPIAGCIALPSAAGSAVCAVALPQGPHAITAHYSGSSVYLPSQSAVLMQAVNAAPKTVPGAPSITQAVPGNAQAAIHFAPPASNGNSPITSYAADCGGVTGSGSLSPVVVAGLTNGTNYSCTLVAINSIGSSAAAAPVNVTPSAGAALALSAAYSRKAHAGVVRDLPLQLEPAMGVVSVEPRMAGDGGTHLLALRFNNTVTSVGMVGTTAGQVTHVIAGDEVRLTLTGVADGQRATVSLTGINGSLAAQVSVGFLLGDRGDSQRVTASDAAALKARGTEATDAGNFRGDFNLSGVVDGADLAILRSRLGAVLP